MGDLACSFDASYDGVLALVSELLGSQLLLVVRG